MIFEGSENRTPRPTARFATTRWSIVTRAASAGTDDARAALGHLVERYWYPLYAFARRKGHADPDAMDLTQGFFAHLLSADALASVSAAKGRFRSFLLASFGNYIANQLRAATTTRRGGAAVTVSLTAGDLRDRYDREPIDDQTPELLFERSWVVALLDGVRARLADDYRQAGKAELFRLLEPHLTHRPDAAPRVEIGRALNLSAAAIGMSLHRMRSRYRELLRQEVAATVNDPADVDDEFRDLMRIASGSP